MEKVVFKSSIPKEMEKSRSNLANDLRSTLRSYEYMLEITELIDFECDFNKNGGCFVHPESHSICCCYGCRGSHGYLNCEASSACAKEDTAVFVPRYKQAINYYNRHFNGKTGFWRANKGCILPRKYRSTTCVFYNCLTKKESDRKSEIIYGMETATTRMLRVAKKLITEWKETNPKK